MKICFITHDIFSVGGIQRVVSVVANELSQYHSIDIICLNKKIKINRSLYNLNEKIQVYIDDGKLSKKIYEKIYSRIIREINKRYNLLKIKRLFNWVTNAYFCENMQNKFIKYLNQKDYDVVIGVSGDASLLLGIISDKINAKTIGWQHNSYEAYFKTQKKYYWNTEEIFEKYLSRLDRYIVLTEHDKNIMDNKFNIQCTTIYNPLSFELEEKSNCTNKEILFVGRLAEQQKGLDLLLEAFNSICHKCEKWILRIVGDGPDKEKIIKIIKENDLNERVIIDKFTDNVIPYYLNASIFISTSRWEGFGLVITEAMECGLPVISFANSGPREIINKNGINGCLVECGNVRELSEKIVELINDYPKRKLISENAKIRAKEFSINYIGDKWRDVLDNLFG